MKKIWLAIIAVCMLCVSCENPALPDTTTDAATGTVQFTAAVPAVMNSSASRAAGSPVTAVSVVLTRDGYTSVTITLQYASATGTASGEAQGIALGAWTVTGTARNAADVALYTGQSTVTITAGTNAVNLQLIEESGVAKINLTWPDTYAFSTLSITATRANFDAVTKTVTLGQVSSITEYIHPLIAGDWSIQAKLYLNSVQYYAYTSTVTVTTNAEAVLSGTMTPVKTSPVVAAPGSGNYTGPYTVALACATANSVIRYTTSGTTPTSSIGTIYSEPISLDKNASIKAISYVPNSTTIADGDVCTFDYGVKAAMPTPDVVSGTTSADAFALRLSTLTEGATIRFTLDGSIPSSLNGYIYSDTIPIWISTSTATVKAVAIRSGNNNSDLAVYTYSVTNSDLVTVVPVAGGTFSNGTADMTVSSFYMGKFEITQKQYSTVMGSVSSDSTHGSGDNYPAYYVTWYNAASYCNALSALEGYESVYTINGTDVIIDYTKNGYRLPTEAEWEFAARGGNGSKGYTYSGSNTIGAVARYNISSGTRTAVVGSYAANELGLYDMSGNVWEWCGDWYGTYPSSAQTNYKGPSTGSSRVVRGGSWFNDASFCSVSYRYIFTPSPSYLYDGFRVVRSAQ